MFWSRTDEQVPYTALEAIRVKPELEAEFIDWDRRYTEAMDEVRGFLGSETLAPQLPDQPEWIVAARWASQEDMDRFGRSPVYERFEVEGARYKEQRSTVQFFEGDVAPAANIDRTVTSVLYWTVPDEQVKPFRSWHEKYAQAMSRARGFEGYQLQEPIEGKQADWVEVVRWENVFDRDAWIRSHERQRMLELGEEYFTTFKSRNIRTSFEGWFRFDDSTAGSPVPTWKQSMVILFILYPTVFLLTVYVTNPLEWPLWAGLFLGNVLSVALMGFVITPLVMRYVLGWWLNPPPTASPERERNGIILLVASYALFLVIFSIWPT